MILQIPPVFRGDTAEGIAWIEDGIRVSQLCPALDLKNANKAQEAIAL
jgi:hypothetical protein